MGFPKTIKRLNSMWIELLDQFVEDELTPREVDCGSEQSAMALRLEFYKVRRVILGESLPGGKPEDPELATHYSYVLNSREVKVRGSTVVFDHRDNNWVGKLLQKVKKAEPAQQVIKVPKEGKANETAVEQPKPKRKHVRTREAK